MCIMSIKRAHVVAMVAKVAKCSKKREEMIISPVGNNSKGRGNTSEKKGRARAKIRGQVINP
jgi:hypothetical protein